jgi:hypothetical protein
MQKQLNNRSTSFFEKVVRPVYEKSISHINPPKTIQTMTRAFQQICDGEDPWTALGNFRNAWFGYAKTSRQMLVTDPLFPPQESTEHTRRWAAFCAASVEFLCERYDVPCPQWAYDPAYTLSEPWYRTIHLDDKSFCEKLQKDTPAPFAKRNIFCGNRLFQNKYEMVEWVMEARAKGLTDPVAIGQYAREREIRFHGA